MENREKWDACYRINKDWDRIKVTRADGTVEGRVENPDGTFSYVGPHVAKLAEAQKQKK